MRWQACVNQPFPKIEANVSTDTLALRVGVGAEVEEGLRWVMLIRSHTSPSYDSQEILNITREPPRLCRERG